MKAPRGHKVLLYRGTEQAWRVMTTVRNTQRPREGNVRSICTPDQNTAHPSGALGRLMKPKHER